MADEFDRAQELDEKLRATSEAAHREAANSLEAQPTGYCLNCNTALHTKTHRWCDAECRDDWQTRENTRHLLRR